jgi:hypothetical protein
MHPGMPSGDKRPHPLRLSAPQSRTRRGYPIELSESGAAVDQAGHALMIVGAQTSRKTESQRRDAEPECGG